MGVFQRSCSTRSERQMRSARISGRPALISLATVRLMVRERDRTRFDHRKSEQALGIRFRPVEETLRDTIAWYRENGWLKNEPSKGASLRQAGEPTAATKSAPANRAH